jgi:riboflavin transporter FmnP
MTNFEHNHNSVLWGLGIGVAYGCLFGALSNITWLIGIPAVFMAVTAVGELIRLFKKIDTSMPQYWLATLLGALAADFLIIILPLAIVTFQGDLNGTTAEKVQVIWKFYRLSLNSIGSNLILTITAGLGLLGFIGIYRRINTTQ